MSAGGAPGGPGGGVLGVVLGPVHLAGRVVQALESLPGAVAEVAAIRSELARVRAHSESLAATAQHLATQTDAVLTVAGHISAQAQPLGEILPTLARVEEALTTRLDAVHEVAVALEGDDSHLNRGLRDLGRAVETRLDGLHELVAALEGDESHLNESVGDLGRRLAAMHENIVDLQREVERVTHRLPDPSRGPLERARDVLTSGDRDASA